MTSFKNLMPTNSSLIERETEDQVASPTILLVTEFKPDLKCTLSYQLCDILPLAWKNPVSCRTSRMAKLVIGISTCMVFPGEVRGGIQSGPKLT